MTIKFMSLSSGSSGNCYYLGTDTYGILIDAGISLRNIRKTLRSVNIDMNTIRGVFVTHDHADHIRAVGNIGEKLNIPIYTTKLIHQGIRNSYSVVQKLSPLNIRYVEKEQTLEIKDFQIEPFEVPHDGTDNVGYHIRIDHKIFTFITDLGTITPTVQKYIEHTNYLVIEANYDLNMLRTGKYPASLKRRIAGDHGHMCNDDTADFLAHHFTSDLRYIWLCHLSKDNNLPELAFNTVKNEMEKCGIKIGKDVQLCALQRTIPSELYFF